MFFTICLLSPCYLHKGDDSSTSSDEPSDGSMAGRNLGVALSRGLFRDAFRKTQFARHTFDTGSGMVRVGRNLEEGGQGGVAEASNPLTNERLAIKTARGVSTGCDVIGRVHMPGVGMPEAEVPSLCFFSCAGWTHVSTSPPVYGRVTSRSSASSCACSLARACFWCEAVLDPCAQNRWLYKGLEMMLAVSDRTSGRNPLSPAHSGVVVHKISYSPTPACNEYGHLVFGAGD